MQGVLYLMENTFILPCCLNNASSFDMTILVTKFMLGLYNHNLIIFLKCCSDQNPFMWIKESSYSFSCDFWLGLIEVSAKNKNMFIIFSLFPYNTCFFSFHTTVLFLHCPSISWNRTWCLCLWWFNSIWLLFKFIETLSRKWVWSSDCAWPYLNDF